LESPSLSAKIEVFDHFMTRLIQYFEGLSENLNRWKEPKEYLSLERHLKFMAINDSLGHITIRITLCDSTGSAGWVAEHPIVVEVGQLAEISARARRFFNNGS
jgi:hypothetical protein